MFDNCSNATHRRIRKLPIYLPIRCVLPLLSELLERRRPPESRRPLSYPGRLAAPRQPPRRQAALAALCPPYAAGGSPAPRFPRSAVNRRCERCLSGLPGARAGGLTAARGQPRGAAGGKAAGRALAQKRDP